MNPKDLIPVDEYLQPLPADHWGNGHQLGDSGCPCRPNLYVDTDTGQLIIQHQHPTE